MAGNAGGAVGRNRWENAGAACGAVGRQSLDAAGAAAGAAGAGVLLAELPLSELPDELALLVEPADFEADEPPRLSVL